MNRDSMVSAFFDEYGAVPPECIAQRIFWSLSSTDALAHFDSGTLAPVCMALALEFLCRRELRRHLRPDEEIAVGTQMECWLRGVILVGSRIRLTGWVERLGERDVSFRVKAQDEQEVVYEGRFRFTIVRQTEMARQLARKEQAIARREMFRPA
jgi:fluoroacetyl-CoA thioesterase